MIVAMAIVTTIAPPAMLRWALARLPLRTDEKARLEREAYAAKGFVAKLERQLLVVDESPEWRICVPSGRLRCRGALHPHTVLHIGRDAKRQEEHRSRVESPEAAIQNRR
jgi:hypothetical protein